MFRIDSEGATLDNKYTEGDPSLGVPATVVSADWLNSTQEELCAVIEANGIALSKVATNQLNLALIEFFLRGGRATPISQALANTQVAAADVVGLTFDSATVKAKICLYDIERKTDTVNKQETGILFITRDTSDNIWRISKMSVHDDDVGVTLSSVVSAGTVSKLQYVTDTMAGAGHDGKMKVTSIFEIRV